VNVAEQVLNGQIDAVPVNQTRIEQKEKKNHRLITSHGTSARLLLEIPDQGYCSCLA
jgi:hypothetical protein